MQSNIETVGYRSLQEGEEVEFDLVVAEDGKKKAFRVTGPDGAPPQVSARAGLARGSERAAEWGSGVLPETLWQCAGSTDKR